VDSSALILVASFFALLLLNVPISISIGMATLLAMLVNIESFAAMTTVAQRMLGGVNSFALLAIPFFVLSGYLMGRGGMAGRLINFAKVLVGSLPGGLAIVNVISCVLFGSISGSAVAATSAVGSFMIPSMEEEGYDKNFAAALTAASATTGMLIPPSNILIVYAVASGGISIAALFIAGYLPGLLLGAALTALCFVYAKKQGMAAAGRSSLAEVGSSFVAALPSLLLIFLVIGGIVGGVFTATEAGAIAVLYALLLSVVLYREISPGQLPEIFLKSVETTAVVMFLIAASMAMSWMLAYEGIPQRISELLLGLSENRIIILLIINILLLFVGAFLDMTPAVLIFTPILLPVAVQLGMSPLHFGIMLVMNLCIGLCTPPVGNLLFVSCAVAKTSIGQLLRPLVPMYFVMFGALLIVTFVPAVSESLPQLFGLFP